MSKPNRYRRTKKMLVITGFSTIAENEAYEQGRKHQAATYDKFIADWNGETNSVIGQLLYDKIKLISKQ